MWAQCSCPLPPLTPALKKPCIPLKNPCPEPLESPKKPHCSCPPPFHGLAQPTSVPFPAHLTRLPSESLVCFFSTSSPGVVPRYTSLSSHRAQEDRDNLCLVRTVYPVPGMCMVQKRGAINAWQMKALGESPVYQCDSHVQTQYYNKDICNLHVLRDLHASSHRIHTVPCKIALQGSGSHDHRQGESGMMSMGQ